MLRAKEMGFQEWSRFLEAVDQAALEGGGNIPALLVREFGEAEKSLVLLAGQHLEQFEAAAPSDWMDYPEAVGDRWVFLAGDRSLVTKFGLKLGAN
jgi:hypothetical protein